MRVNAMAPPDMATSTPALDHESRLWTLSKGVASHNGVQIDRRRLLGAYYTPEDLAIILVRWALAHRTGTVLDPSYGGCAFLKAATRVLAEMGVTDPGRLVFGVDVDPSCVDHARNSAHLFEENCIVRDFLGLSPDDVRGAPFQAVVGNPPYVRHHWLKGKTRSAARAIVESSHLRLPATASTWAYFLVHALGFLAPGGRLAMLVPEAIFQADYAAPIRDALAARFGRVVLIHIRDRLFDGTDEPVVMVAASGFGAPGKLTVEAVERAEDLVRVLGGSTPRRPSPCVTMANGRTVSSAIVGLLDELERSQAIQRVGKLATVRIGFVTGANNHFIRSKNDLDKLAVPNKARRAVVARTRWLSGLEFTQEDHRGLAEASGRAFLVRPTPAYEQHPGVQRWIDEGLRASVQRRSTCLRREAWFRVELPPPPDAFATCTRLGSPLLVLNRTPYQCSNALHAVWWRPQSRVTPEAAAVGFLTSAVSVWAELHGRRYGGGVLKLEPGTLNRLPLPLVADSEQAFDEIDGLLRRGREEDARSLADEVVLGAGLGLPEEDIRRLQRARSLLMSQRRPVRNGDHRDRD